MFRDGILNSPASMTPPAIASSRYWLGSTPLLPGGSVSMGCTPIVRGPRCMLPAPRSRRTLLGRPVVHPEGLGGPHAAVLIGAAGHGPNAGLVGTLRVASAASAYLECSRTYSVGHG